MKALDIIKSRRSVRTFDGVPLSEEDAKKISEFADSVENPYGITITWKLLDAKENGLSSPVIVGSDLYLAGKMPRVPHAEEAFGYSFEKVVLYAESLGIGTTWIAGTMNRGAFENALGLSGDEVMPCVSPLGYPSKKMSLRENMMRKGIKADTRFEFSDVFFNGFFDKPLSKEDAGKLANAFEAVRWAPSAVNKQPWRAVLSGDKTHFYEKSSRGYEDGKWDIQKIDLGIALCHFELAAIESGYSASFEIADPGIRTPEDIRYIATYTVS